MTVAVGEAPSAAAERHRRHGEIGHLNLAVVGQVEMERWEVTGLRQRPTPDNHGQVVHSVPTIHQTTMAVSSAKT